MEFLPSLIMAKNREKGGKGTKFLCRVRRAAVQKGREPREKT